MMSQIKSTHRKIEKQYLKISYASHRDYTVLLSTEGGSEISVLV